MRSPGSAYFGHRQLVGGLGLKSALSAGVVEGTKAQEDRERILNYLGVALTALPQVLLTGSPD